MTAHVAAFAALGFVMLALHLPLDMWIQTEDQAQHKGDRATRREVRAGTLGADKWLRINARGWGALVGHVATYTAGMALGIGAVMLRTGLPIDGGRFLVGLAVTAVTHGWADRRHTLGWLARRVGKGEFWHRETPVAGAFWLDQAWHAGWLVVAALIMC